MYVRICGKYARNMKKYAEDMCMHKSVLQREAHHERCQSQYDSAPLHCEWSTASRHIWARLLYMGPESFGKITNLVPMVKTHSKFPPSSSTTVRAQSPTIVPSSSLYAGLGARLERHGTWSLFFTRKKFVQEYALGFGKYLYLPSRTRNF